MPRETQDGRRNLRWLRIQDRVYRAIGDVTIDGRGVDLRADAFVLRVREAGSTGVHERSDLTDKALGKRRLHFPRPGR